MALTPGERIDLKKKLATTLGKQDWNDVNLTLEEFGLSVWDDWRGDGTMAYVIEMLRGETDDEKLLQLDAYLHPSQGPIAPPQLDTFDDSANPWSGDGLRLFISHIHDYADHAGALRRELATRSIDGFVAHDAIKPTEEWLQVILYALRTCDACLALLSPGFRDSAWTDQEVGFCMARDRLVIPVEYGVTPYGFLGTYQALPVKKGQTEADISLAVFELLVRKPQTRDAMARVLVQRWARTASYHAARENYSFLKTIPQEAWTPQLVNDVRDAREGNVDLREASINWQPSEAAIDALFSDLPFAQPATAATADDIPF
jgi:hypothetical protein